MSGGGYFYSGDNINAVVADIGAYATKIGFAGEDYPKGYFRSNTAVVENDGDLAVKYDFLSRPLESDNEYRVANPVDDATGLWYGENELWYKLIEKYLEHGYRSGLNSQTHHHPLLLVERSYNPPPIRQQLLELLMEDLQVPAIFYGRDATLACYACGRTSGTVVDIGYSGITVTPVYEGYVETKGIRRLPVGTQKIDETIAKTLDTLHGTAFLPLYQVQKFKQRQESIHYLARLAVAQQCREEGSGAAVLAVSDVGFTAPSMSFELPDGTLVDIPAKKRFGAADTILGQEEDSLALREETFSETLTKLKTLISQASENQEMQDDADKEHFDQVFSEASSVGLLKRRQEAKKNKSSKKPDSSGKSFSHTWKYLQKACLSSLQSQQDLLTTSSIPHMVCDSAFRCDRDQQASLLGNVVVAGGGACLGPTDQALPDYLREQVEAIIHQHTPGWRVKVLSPNLQERSICSWLGGSILGSLGTFHEMWITKKEYDEWGSAIVNRKCP